MPESKQYQWIHLIAKGVIYLIYVGLGVVSIETNNPYLSLVVGTTVWLFGVNTAGYLIESVIGHRHLHNKV